jgi:hypothetical protein
MILTPEMRARRSREIWEDLHDYEYEELSLRNVAVTALTTLALFLGAGILLVVAW